MWALPSKAPELPLAVLPLSGLSVLYWFPPRVHQTSFHSQTIIYYREHLLVLLILLFYPPNSHPSCLSPHPLTSFNKNTADEGLMLLTVRALPSWSPGNGNCESNSSSRKEAGHGRAGGGRAGGGHFLKGHREKGIWPMPRVCCSIR